MAPRVVPLRLLSMETGCSYGCLGCGDCVAACQFDAIHMNPETGLPEVDEEKCTACGACAKACPKSIIEIRPQGKKSRRIYVQCVNKDKGAVARKACTVLYRLRQVCEGLSVRGYHAGKQSGLH